MRATKNSEPPGVAGAARGRGSAWRGPGSAVKHRDTVARCWRPALAPLLLLGATLAACAGDATATDEALGARLAEVRLLQWRLPPVLREVSGLTLAPPGERLFAIADERAVIVEIDYLRGSEVKRFGVGDPILAGDFEGLAAHGGSLYAITSTGRLLRFSEGAPGEHVAGAAVATGLEQVCEVEGLDAEPAGEALLIACKKEYDDDGERRVSVYRWLVDAGRLDPQGPLVADERALAEAVGNDEFSPSGIAVEADGTVLWLIAARQRGVARLRIGADRRLHLLEARRFPASARHRQSEGIALFSGGAVAIADEGGKKSDGGTLGIYAKR